MCKECGVTKNKIIKVKENASAFQILNKNSRSVIKTKVDGCKITIGTRCDWHFEDTLSHQEIFVELKGKNVSHGYEQIEATVVAISKNIKTNKGFIVCTKCPPLLDSKTQILKAKARKKNIALTIKSSIFSDTIESLIT